MALKDIFKMTKANRYTADGREELIKAQEAVTEDRRYNIGEISEKTGLQKTANGWVKPKNGKQPGAKTGPGKSPDATLAKEIANMNHFEESKKAAQKTKREEARKEDRREGEARARDFQKKVESGEIVYNKETGKFEDGPKAKSESKPAEKTEKKSALKLPDEKSSFSTDVNRMKKLKKEDYKQYTIQLEKLHSKYPINKWKDLLNKTTQDEAPRVLTGDTRIRVRK